MSARDDADDRPGRRITIRVAADLLSRLDSLLARSPYGTLSQVIRHALELGATELERRADEGRYPKSTGRRP